jgi:hypothetical protein
VQLTTKKSYSDTEQILFGLIKQKGSPISTNELVLARLRQGPWDVQYPNHVISTLMARLIRKVEDNNEPFRVVRSHGPRRREVEFWIEPRTSPSSRSGTTRISPLD